MNKREYTIRLVNNNLGHFYFHYENMNGFYVFSKKDSGVKTWKSIENVNKKSLNIFSELIDGYSKIYLECTDLVNNNIIKKNEKNIIISRKKYFLIIDKVSHQKVELLNSISDLNTNISAQSSNIISLINESDRVKKLDIIQVNRLITTLNSDINKYNNYCNISDNSNNYRENYIDVIDVSNSFRLLKLKKLMELV